MEYTQVGSGALIGVPGVPIQMERWRTGLQHARDGEELRVRRAAKGAEEVLRRHAPAARRLRTAGFEP